MTPTSRLSFCLLFALLMVGCASTPSAQVAQIPTQAVLPTLSVAPTDLPTETPTVTDSPMPSVTPSSTLTPSPDAALTQAAEIGATNAMLLQTLYVVQTLSVATYTPSPTSTPVLTATPTPLPTNTSDPVTMMTPSLYFAREALRLHACASRLCETVARVSEGDAVMVTGRTSGEAVELGNTMWYRVDHLGRQVYAYGNMLSSQPVVATVEPVTTAPNTAPGFISPLRTCPGSSFTCGLLTCEQAYACLAAGNNSLDQDGDGIPCESVCGG